MILNLNSLFVAEKQRIILDENIWYIVSPLFLLHIYQSPHMDLFEGQISDFHQKLLCIIMLVLQV